MAASQVMLRTGVKSPARAFIKPASSTRSILKRPSPLPLTPNPLPFAASFSVVPRSAKLSPHVHFAASPTMVSTFAAFSPNTYDRGPIIISPTSLETSLWGSRVYSPSVDAFKLSNPPAPKRTSRKMKSNLTIPTSEDPRSPKPYVSNATVRFEELTSHVPRGARGMDGLAKALSSYPRSPYPSAPISPAEAMEGDCAEAESPARWPNRSNAPDKRSSLLTRTRSLEAEPKRRIGAHLISPTAQQFLSPVQESPRLTITRPPPLNLGGDVSPAESTRLSHAFWESVSLQPKDMLSPSAGRREAMTSPIHTPPILFGRKDGTLWSPGLPRKEWADTRPKQSLLSPVPKARIRKSTIASPSPNDPFAAFPSFTIALSGSAATIAYPPRALMEQY